MLSSGAKKKLRIAGVIVAALVGLRLLFGIFFETGHTHYWLHEDELHQLLGQAKEVPIEPRFGYDMSVVEGRLEVAEGGEITVRGSASGHLVLRVPMAAGLHQQGYVYVEDPDVQHEQDPGFPYVEHHDFTRVADRWWGYISRI